MKCPRVIGLGALIKSPTNNKSATCQNASNKLYLLRDLYHIRISILARVATAREKYLENEFFSRSGKSQGILLMAREI